MRRLRFSISALFFTLVLTLSACASEITLPKFKAFDNAGLPLNGGHLYTYKPGTTTVKSAYSDKALTTPLSDPIVLDSNGEAAIYGNGSYKLKLMDSTESTTFWTIDNWDGIGAQSPAVSNYTSLNAAVSAIGSTITELLIDTPQTLTASLTVPATLSLRVTGTGSINLAGYTLTVNGPFQAGLYRVFSGTGTVTGLDYAYPEWWSINTTPGTTDMYSAISSALASTNVIYLSSTTYRLSAGVTVRSGSTLKSDSFAPSNPPSGAILLFDLSVPTCVTLGGTSANNGSATIKGMTVTRAAGTIPAGSIGVLNQNTYGAIIEDVPSTRHAIGIKHKGDQNTQGIATMVNRFYTGAITDTHELIDSFPEIRHNQCRYGMDGPGDVNCNGFVGIQGGSTTNAANGPNTISYVNSQFNQGQNTVANWLIFANKLPGSISDTEYFVFDTCYIETVANGIYSDATWTQLNALQISNTKFNMPTNIPFLSLDPATTPNDWTIDGFLCGGTFVLAPLTQMNFVNVANAIFNGAVSVTGVGNSSVAFTGNTYKNGLTVAGSYGNAGSGTFKGGGITSGVLTYTGTGGSFDIYPYNGTATWTPGLTIGGSSTGITYSSNAGTYSLVNKRVTATFRFILTSKGGLTGSIVQLTNLPFTASTNTGNAGVIPYALNVSGLTGPLTVQASASSTVANIYEYGATGITNIAGTNLADNTTLYGSVEYYIP